MKNKIYITLLVCGLAALVSSGGLSAQSIVNENWNPNHDDPNFQFALESDYYIHTTDAFSYARAEHQPIVMSWYNSGIHDYFHQHLLLDDWPTVTQANQYAESLFIEIHQTYQAMYGW